MVFDRFVDEHLRLEHPEVWAEVNRLRAEREALLDQDRTNELQREVESLRADEMERAALLRQAEDELERLRKDHNYAVKAVDRLRAENAELRRDVAYLERLAQQA